MVHPESPRFVPAADVRSAGVPPSPALTRMRGMASLSSPRPRHPLIAGFRSNPLTLLLIAAINTGIALVLWIDDTRPFWHPLVTVQLSSSI